MPLLPDWKFNVIPMGSMITTVLRSTSIYSTYYIYIVPLTCSRDKEK